MNLNNLLMTLSDWIKELPPVDMHYAETFWSGIIVGTVIGYLLCLSFKIKKP